MVEKKEKKVSSRKKDATPKEVQHFRITKRTSIPIRADELTSYDKEFVPSYSIDFLGQKPLLDKVAFCIQSKLPVLLIGETGTGKTSLVRYLASMTNNSFRRVNHNGGTTVEDIVGKILVDTSQGTYWVDGVLVDAMRHGHWYLADELNAASAEINFAYHSLLDDDGFVVLAEHKGEVVRPHKNFRFFGSMNPVEDYAGTKEINKALMSRFAVFNVDFPAPKDERDILMKTSGIGQAAAQEMVKFASKIRAQHASKDLSFVVSTRDLMMWSKMFVYYKKFILSAEASILNKLPKDEFDVVKDMLALMFKSVDQDESKKQQDDAFTRISSV